MALVKIDPESYGVELEILYATPNNVTGEPIYKTPFCFLHKDAANCLKKASNYAQEIGYKIKIFDAFRPIEAQRFLWNKFPDPEFVSNPDSGVVPHCRGIAVDLTLVDNNNEELDMGTDFDAFTPLSHHGNVDVSEIAQKNRHMLMGLMAISGWDFNPNEWWHYQLPFFDKYEKYSEFDLKSNII